MTLSVTCCELSWRCIPYPVPLAESKSPMNSRRRAILMGGQQAFSKGATLAGERGATANFGFHESTRTFQVLQMQFFDVTLFLQGLSEAGRKLRHLLLFQGVVEKGEKAAADIWILYASISYHP